MKLNKKNTNLFYKILKPILTIVILLFLVYIINKYFFTSIKEGNNGSTSNNIQEYINKEKESTSKVKQDKHRHQAADTRVEAFNSECDHSSGYKNNPSLNDNCNIVNSLEDISNNPSPFE